MRIPASDRQGNRCPVEGIKSNGDVSGVTGGTWYNTHIAFPCHQANVKDHDFVFTHYAP